MSQSQGRPLRLSHPDIVRWRGQLLVTGTCHVWMGAVGSDGYGRIAVRNPEDGARTLAPHQVGPGSGTGRSRLGRRWCMTARSGCAAAPNPGHLRVGTQSENMRQAVAPGRAVGPARVGSTSAARQGRPGRSRPALRAAADRSPAALATVLAAVIADGHPLRDPHPLFDLPVHPAGTGGVRGRGVPGCRHSGRRVGTGGAAGPGRVVAAVRRVPPATVDRGLGVRGGAAPG